MATFIGTNLTETFVLGTLSPSVTVNGNPDFSEPDFFIALGGNDTVDGGNDNDTAFLGAGNDTFIWNPGDDNDTVEGQEGLDTLQFNGANVDEVVEILPKPGAGERAFFLRAPANVIMDLDRVERIEFNALGGVDQINVNNLRGTDVTLVDLDLAATAGTGIVDGVIDRVTVEGTGGIDSIGVRTLGGSTIVGGLSARVEIAGEDGGLDVLRIEAGAGNDRISAALLTDDGMKLVALGGAGNDFIRGGDGRDDLFGQTGRDRLFGGRGNDELTGGSGADQYIFAGQNGTDRIEGFRDGVDQIRIQGYGSALNSFADLAGDIIQVGADVHIRLGNNVSGAGRIVIENFTVAQLSAADFDF